MLVPIRHRQRPVGIDAPPVEGCDATEGRMDGGQDSTLNRAKGFLFRMCAETTVYSTQNKICTTY